ncbi:MAG TPA: hypothetical protein VFR67_28505 [Pilimelia sp.]|nr:hypothetical protein [Pilimelia sp.]
MSKPSGTGRRARAAERTAFVADRSGDYDRNALAEAMAERMEAELAAAEAAEAAAAEEAAAGRLTRRTAGALARAVAINNTRRWVPIGPSVIRAKAGQSFKRATGRVRDIAVSDDGKRAYAATAKGGLWYSEDAGQFWSPVGGWAERAAIRGGVNSAQSCGCLTVKFGATAGDDFVMVGTGELQGFSRAPIRPALAGLGVLSAKGPVTFAGGADPWEPEAGISVFEGLGIFKLTRDPAATAGRTSGAGKDRVLAATSAGLFLGERRAAGPAPHTGEFVWSARPAVGPFMGLPVGTQPLVTDVLWLTRGAAADGRIVVAVARGLETADAAAPTGSGVAYSDDLGVTYHWVTNLDPTVAGAHRGIGRMSLASPESDRVYVLGERHRPAPPANIQSLWRVPSMTAATPTADLVGGMPDIWTGNPTTGKNQRDYDQAIAVEVVGGVDRVYLGGNYRGPASSVWCFNVQMPARTLVAAPGISRTGAPLAPPPPLNGGDGAPEDGLIGNDIHADVHNIRLPGMPGPNRQVWIATDGGIYVSNRAGRVNTFESRASGLAAVEVQFHAPHPTSTHFGAIGTQDNGRHVRIGDVVWEDVMGGDGGGVAFHPVRSEIIVSQYNYVFWDSTPGPGFNDPVTQGSLAAPRDREQGESAFYSGAAAVKLPPVHGRIAVGTNRVWLSDDVGTLPSNTWNVLPFSTAGALATNPRPGGLDAPANRGRGVPGGPPYGAVANGRGPFGPILTQKWANERTLLVLFAKGLVRWKQDPVNSKWTAKVLVGPVAPPGVTDSPNPATNPLSDLAPIPGTNDFYLVTTGDPGSAAVETCLHFHDASTTFRKTTLRAQLAPLNPAYAVIVDPGTSTDVYVGTATGVWRGVRGAGPPAAAGAAWPHTWTPEVNGTPQNVVQDLSVWHDPAVVGGPRLLRASMQSRGVWEMDLNAASEPQRTYVRVHAADDRRALPTPLVDPQLAPVTPAVAYASPDIVVRPRPSPTTAPAWRQGPGVVIDAGNPIEYELWTFQTAFRWLYPSVAADGRWSRPLERLIELHRTTDSTLAGGREIDKKLWDAVVGGTTVNAAGVATARNTAFVGPGHAVYRPPWQTAADMAAVATEIDLVDHVLPVRALGVGLIQLYNEPSTIDVLIHHRDTRPLAANNAFAILLWRSAASQATLESFDVGPARPYAASAALGAVPGAPGAGWNRVLRGGSPLLRLPVPLDARMPRAVSVDVDFSGVAAGQHVLIMAFVGSSVDLCVAPPVGLPANPTLADLTCGWPYAAARIIRVEAR